MIELLVAGLGFLLSAGIFILMCAAGAFLALVAYRARERRLARLEASRLVPVTDLLGGSDA